MDYLELMMESGFADLGINFTANRPTWHQVPEKDDKHFTVSELEGFRDSRGLKPDAIVFRGIENKVPLVIDFVCTHQPRNASYNAMGLLENSKRRKCEGYLSQEGGQRVDIVAYAMSSKALLSPRTLKEIDAMNRLSTRKGFAYEVIRRTKVAIINFEPFRKHAIAMRHSNGTLQAPPGTGQQSDSDNDAAPPGQSDEEEEYPE